MSRTKAGHVIAAIVLGAGLVATTVTAEEPVAPATVVVRNARVLTVDPGFRIASAVAIVGDRIAAVGDEAAIAPWVGPATQVIDAGGQTVLPGLYDSHVHPLGAAASELDHPLPVFDSLEAIRAYIQARALEQAEDTWIVVRYAFPTRLKERRFPTRAELDTWAPRHRVLHQAGPAGIANSRALLASGITRETLDPPGGQVVKDRATGEPTGLLRNAYSLLKDLPSNAYGDRGRDDTDEAVRGLFRLYNARGLTSVADRGASDTALATYRRLRDRGQLTVRINATRILAPDFGDRAGLVEAVKTLAGDDAAGEPNGPTGVGDHWVRIGPLKVFLDGGMLNGTALMRTPYGTGPTYQIDDPHYRGLQFVPPEKLRLVAEVAAQRGWQMTAHCAGEGGLDELLSAYEHADRVIGIRGRRWLVTHANFTSAENLRRCAALGVGADLQPAWIWEDTATLLGVLGPERMAWFHPYRRWLDAGLVIGGGSDHMVRLDALRATNPWDPWFGIQVAVTRRYRGGGVHEAAQVLTRAEAIRFYTIDNARLHHEERDKGSIEVGKLADLIAVDRNPLECADAELAQTRVEWTMVGGRLVHGQPSR
jgi:predicted amidohydrolase YtcJ